MARKNSNRSKPSYVRRLGLVEAVKSGFGIFIRGKILPSVALGLPRPVVRILAEKACRERVDRENAAKNHEARREARAKNPEKQKFNDLVNSMTHDQRRAWAKASHRGLAKKDIKALKRIIKANPPRRKAVQ